MYILSLYIVIKVEKLKLGVCRW